MNDRQQVVQQLIHENRLEEAKTQCQILCQEQPNNADARFTMGLINAQSGNLDEATTDLQHVIKLNPKNSSAFYNLAKIASLKGLPNQAIRYYQQAIYFNPKFTQAYSNLGNIQHQQGKLQIAAFNLKRATQLQPHNASLLYNYANILKALGNIKEALQFYQQALNINPKFAEAFYNIGIIHQQQQHLEEAVSNYQNALRHNTDYVEALVNLSYCLKLQGMPEEAIPHLKKALRINPNFAETYHCLGNVLYLKGQHKLAVENYIKALRLKPDFLEAYYSLAITYQILGNVETAIENYQNALRLNPDFAEAYNNLGVLVKSQGFIEDAIKNFQKALAIKPDFIDAHINLGNTFEDQGYANKAIECYQQALAIDKEIAGIHNNLGNALKETGQHEAALEHYQKALQLKPDYAEANSNLLFMLSYNVLRSPQAMLEESQHWDYIQGREGKAHLFTHPARSDPNKRLRIGYVSPDMRYHAVSYFLEPILAAHDRTQLEVFCYADLKQPDAVTQRLQALADHWRPTVSMTDEALAQLIFDDHIDILIDLTGHTAHNRLKTFTYKPAPIQATYLGYFATTGLATMDYWITDETLHPQNTVELATESLFRLPRCCLVYQAAPDAPEVAERSGEDIVFGSFNQLTKTSPATIALWAMVLQAVPQARLLIKAKQLADPAMSTALRSHFAEHGIDSERLILLPHVPSEKAHLETYSRVDIALDTIPRTGGSTTAEALWMGVPVISLAGERFIERISASMLNTIGLDELIADSQQDYVAKARALANDRYRLCLIRTSLRERMAASPLCDANSLAHHLDSAYRKMWEHYLENTNSMHRNKDGSNLDTVRH